ncbi:magnesium transporter CorA family protein [Pseudomonas viridiflava]|uniref:Mg2+ transporter protein n=1 Tax=Pseudomonas viridiflava TaxID=33069 RepID=A0A3M5PIX6_PSEVI|nr:magnesium transporter CorA family protein [Pseudomonas viridiflava]MBA1228825.1 magnesium transporter CorA family protein [Pseudomonas viridiflava]RMT84540.1 Mg2+ transporter protein [Pseudomonas viridiflava]
MIKGLRLDANRLQACDLQTAQVQWFSKPDASERTLLLEQFHLDEHAVASALDPDEVSRIEFHPDALFLIWKRPENYSGKDSFSFDVSSFGVLLKQDQLLLICDDDQPLTSWVTQRPLTQPLDILLEMLFNNIHHYLGHLKVIKMVARELQQKFNSSLENRHLLQMFNLSESLVYYINAIHSNGTVLARLRNHVQGKEYGSASLALIDDMIIENDQCYKQAEIYSTVFAGLMDARGNLVNNSTNNLLRKLTLINVVFLPLNLIAGIGGMSEFSMMTAPLPWWVSYPALLVAMLGMGVAMIWGLRRMARTA